jgi:hypothetical protein
MNNFTHKPKYNIADLLQVTEILRAECPWDLNNEQVIVNNE